MLLTGILAVTLASAQRGGGGGRGGGRGGGGGEFGGGSFAPPARLDVISEGPKTADGFGVNSQAAAIRAKYGSALTEAPNKYEPEVTELTISQGASKTIFEIQDDAVRAFRSGVAPTIDYVEHCG